VRFPLGLLSGPCDASRSPSGHSWSVTGPLSRPRAVDCACSADLRSPPASETARQRPSASRLSRPPDYLERHPGRSMRPFQTCRCCLAGLRSRTTRHGERGGGDSHGATPRKRRRLRTLWLSSSNVALSPIGRQSSRQTRHATCAAGLVSRLVTTLMLPCVALEYGHS